MKIMLILKNVIKNYYGRLDKALNFLDEINNRLRLKGEEFFFWQCLRAECLLGLNLLHECNDVLKEVKFSLEKLFDVDHIVYAYFYKLYALYYDNKKNYDEFYNYSLQFFAYCKDDHISNEEKLHLCYKMALASLIGEKMFNFSELIEKEFFKVLINSNYEWVYNLIKSLSTGKVDQFVNMLNNYRSHFESESILIDKKDFLDLKIRIAALLDLVFQKNKNERVLTFNEIKVACCCDFNQVELIAMKSISLGLIKGYIDQVEKVLIVKWIQPKYLDTEKLEMLSERLDLWIKKTNNMLVDFEEKSMKLVN
jgi:26S proteasome regulatory subunit N9